MQIGRYPSPHRTRCPRLPPQQPCCNQLRFARVLIKRRRQNSSAFSDKPEQSGKAYRRDEKKMYSKPSRINALRFHLVDAKRTLRFRRCFSVLSSTQAWIELSELDGN